MSGQRLVLSLAVIFSVVSACPANADEQSDNPVKAIFNWIGDGLGNVKRSLSGESETRNSAEDGFVADDPYQQQPVQTQRAKPAKKVNKEAVVRRNPKSKHAHERYLDTPNPFTNPRVAGKREIGLGPKASKEGNPTPAEEVDAMLNTIRTHLDYISDCSAWAGKTKEEKARKAEYDNGVRNSHNRTADHTLRMAEASKTNVNDFQKQIRLQRARYDEYNEKLIVAGENAPLSFCDVTKNDIEQYRSKHQASKGKHEKTRNAKSTTSI